VDEGGQVGTDESMGSRGDGLEDDGREVVGGSAEEDLEDRESRFRIRYACGSVSLARL
jgi:hypothetical protein